MNPTTLQREPRYYPRKILEALEIQAQKTGPNEIEGVNRDSGARFSTQTWRSFFYDWRRKEPGLRRWRHYWQDDDYDVRTTFESDTNQVASQSTVINTVDNI